MTDPSTPTTTPSGAGSGPAGRALLTELDRLTTDDVTHVTAARTTRGNYRLHAGTPASNPNGRAFAFRTLSRLAGAGLITITPTAGDPQTATGYKVALTDNGRALLGA